MVFLQQSLVLENSSCQKMTHNDCVMHSLSLCCHSVDYLKAKIGSHAIEQMHALVVKNIPLEPSQLKGP